MNLQHILAEHAKWLRGEGGSRADLSDAYLRYADLRGANLSSADLSRAYLRYADLRGANLSGANLSSADLSDADLSYAILSDADLTSADLSGADLSDAYLSRADLSRADLRGADLRGAILSDAILSDAILRCAQFEAPVVPQLHTKMLAAIEGGGLEMNRWHTCATTHCRAGWAIRLAGDAGRELEQHVGPSAAGAFIIAKSCPYLEKVPKFYDTNENALADIRRCAELEGK